MLLAVALAARDSRRIPDRILVPGIVGTVAFLTLGSFLDGDPWALLRALAGGAAYFAVLLAVALAARRVSRTDAIPFGPAMVAGAGLALALGDTIARWYLG